MFNEIKAHCLAFLRDSANRYILWKGLSWFGMRQKEMKYHCLPQEDERCEKKAMKTAFENQQTFAKPLLNLYIPLLFYSD